MEQLDLRVQKTYKALVEAFERLLLEKEFESISVTEICDAAMIRRPTFYKHFLDKYDFITFFIKHKMNKIFDFAIQKSNDEGVDFFIIVPTLTLSPPLNKFEYQKSTSANVLNFFVFLTHNLQSLLTISNYIFPHNTQYQNAIHIYHPS